MGRDTKLAIAVAVVFVGFGAWYIFSGKTSDTSPDQAKPVAVNTTNKPVTEASKPQFPMVNKPMQPPGLQQPAMTPSNQLASGTPTSPTAMLGSDNGSTTRPSLATPPTPAALTSPTPSAADASPPGLGTPVAARHEVGTATPTIGSTAPPGLAPTQHPAGVGTTPLLANPSGAAAHPLAKPGDKTTSLAPGIVAPVAAAGDAKVHTVVAGDTFSGMAAKYLGNAKYADLIVKANPDIDPRRLQLGAKVKIPPTPAQSAAIASPTAAAIASPAPSAANVQPVSATPAKAPIALKPGQQSYTVKAGDSWYSIARRYLGGDAEWVRLYELNKERVPNRERLSAGTVIVLPEDAKIPAASDSSKTPPKTLTDSSKPSKP